MSTPASVATPAPAEERTSLRSLVSKLSTNVTALNIVALLAAILVLYLILANTANGFLTFNNQMSLLRNAAITGIAATGMTLVIVAGDIDISIGPAAALASVIVAKGMTQWGVPTLGAIAITLLLGAAWGTLAGVLRAKFGVPAFIATLGLWSSLGGLALYSTQALPVVLPLNDPIMDVLAGKLLGVPTPAWILVIAFALFWFISRKTVYGRSVYAVGGNAAAARLAGIAVVRTRILLFMTTGVLSAITGVLLAARMGSGNGTAASGLEFDVITAVAIGGTSMLGGRGSLFGTFLGVLFITVIANGLVLLGVNAFMQDVVRGAIIVLAVLLNVTLARSRSGQRD
jgi:simple sugar transport system permease protein